MASLEDKNQVLQLADSKPHSNTTSPIINTTAWIKKTFRPSLARSHPKLTSRIKRNEDYLGGINCLLQVDMITKSYIKLIYINATTKRQVLSSTIIIDVFSRKVEKEKIFQFSLKWFYHSAILRGKYFLTEHLDMDNILDDNHVLVPLLCLHSCWWYCRVQPKVHHRIYRQSFEYLHTDPLN